MNNALTEQRCLVCHAPLQPWFLKGGRHISRCMTCLMVIVPEGLVRTPSGKTIYDDDSFNVFFTEGNENYYQNEGNILSNQDKVRWLMRYVPKESQVLDAGSGFGHFLKAGEGHFKMTGFDISPQAVAWGRQQLGVNSHIASIDHLPPEWQGKFTAVTLWDTIEHLPDPHSALQKLWALLQRNGKLFISTPDAGSMAAKLWGKNWYFIDPQQHIHLFSRKALVSILKQTRFLVLEYRTIGRYYKWAYVFDRLSNVQNHPLTNCFAGCGKKLPSSFKNQNVYIKLGDVMGIVAEKINE